MYRLALDRRVNCGVRWLYCALLLGSVAQGQAPSSVRLSLTSKPAGDEQPVEGDSGLNSIAPSRFSVLPHGFERNVGQAGPEAKFVLRNGSALFLLADQGAVIASHGIERLRLRPIGGNKDKRPEATGQMAEIANYFIGEPWEWRTNVPTYARIKYEDIYPGIDWVFRTNEGNIEYDFLVAPGADPSQIEIEFSGATRLRLTARGDLVVSHGSFEVHQHAPVLYQTIRGVRRIVIGQYVIRGASRVGFRIGAFDQKESLVIDPVLTYSAMLKATAGGIAVDGQGSAYVAGLTESVSGSEVAYVYKLNPSGTGFVYSVLVGGAADGPASGATSIAVDTAGRAFVAGYTRAADFPTTPNAFQHVYPSYPNSKPAFVFCLNSSGTALVYSTFLGGDYSDFATGIAVDSVGSAYVTGYTSSTAFPTTPGALKTSNISYQTAFVAKLNASGTALVYSTYLGGSGQMNGGTHDAGAAIAVDSVGNAYVVGSTTSPDFPLTPGAFETTSTSIFTGAGFVTKLNPSGSAAIYSTLIGGTTVSATGIALDVSGNAYVSGGLAALDYLSASSIGAQGYGEAFVLKLNATGSTPVYLTKFGGSFEDQANAIAIDSTGAAYFTGFTRSSDFPVQAPVQAVKALEDNITKSAFVSKLDANGALAYSTYLGGQNNGDWGTGIAVGPDQTAYVTGRAGSLRFPTTPGAVGDSSGFGFDTFVSALSTASSCTFAASPLTNAAPANGGPGSISVTSQSGCNWVGVANRPWITVGGNGNGSGSGRLDYLVTPSVNPARTGQISVAGIKVDVMQASGCIYSLGANNVLEGQGGGLVSVSYSVSDIACPLTVSQTPSWIQIPASFQGSFTVSSNPGAPRSARFTIGDQPFVVNQNTSCNFAILSNSTHFSAQGGIGAINFSASSSCSWTAVSNTAWLHVSSFDSSLGNDPLFGNGPGKLNFTMDTNLSTSARSGTFTIGGLTLTVSQLGASSVAMNASPSPAIFGEPITLFAVVVPSTATGKVTFYDGNVVLGTASVSGGFATLSVAIAATGNRKLMARYLGDGQNSSATSSVVSESIRSVPSFGFTPSIITTGLIPHAAAAADFNGDGKLDLVFGGSSNAVTVALGTGSGTFGNRIFSPPFSTNIGIGYLRAADFDLDGKMDVVVAGISELKVLFGNGDGTFGTGDGAFGGTVTLPTAPGPVEVADFNGDGIPDIAVMHRVGWTVGILLGNADRTFSAPVEYPLGTFDCATYFPSGPCGGYETFLAIGDLNGDGVPDVVTVQPTNGEKTRVAVVLLGNADGSLRAPVSYPLPELGYYQPNDSFVLEDLDGDGHLDLVVVPGYGNSVGVLRGNGDGTFTAAIPSYTVIGNNGAGYGVAVVDVNGDGKPDAISALRVIQSGAPVAEVGLSLGNGDGTLQIANLQATSRPDLRSLILGDFNGDGMVDFAALNPNDGEAMVFLGGLPPLLQIAKTHVGNFTQGQIGAKFTITISNAGGSPTTGPITVTDWPGGNMPITSMSGSGWICVGTSCYRTDPLPVGASYPPITVLANIVTFNGETFSAAINEAFVSGGGALGAASAIDKAQIVTTPPWVDIELPAVGQTLSGTTTISGWAVEGLSAVGVNAITSVAVLVDATQVGTATYGGARPDVCATLPGRPGCPNVGWSYDLNVSSLRPGTHTLKIVATDAAGVNGSAQVSFVAATGVASKIGIFRPAAFMMVAEDVNGNIAWDPGIDRAAFFGTAGDTIIYGDWDGSGTTKVGIFRASVGMFALDMNGNGVWDPGIDTFGFFGQAGDVPIVGDWNGDGRTKVGIYRPTTGLFAIDYNGNLAYDPGIDKAHQFGLVGDTPIIGDWNGDGQAKVGVFRSGLWILDSNNNLTLDAGDTQGIIGQAGDTPLLGDWNGDGRTKVGIYRSGVGMFAEDYNGNLTWDNGVDRAGVFGAAGSTPVVGDWTGTGITKVGVFYGNGYWGLDINGNLSWDAGVRWGGFGSGTGDTPVVGKW